MMELLRKCGEAPSLGRRRPSAGCDAAGRGSSSCDEEHPSYDDIMMQDQHVMKMVTNSASVKDSVFYRLRRGDLFKVNQ